MGGAFEGALPESVFGFLQAGEILFVQTLRSFSAWAIMYVTKSEVSHVAFYSGDRKILHPFPEESARSLLLYSFGRTNESFRQLYQFRMSSAAKP
jgi:hypothetical protein